MKACNARMISRVRNRTRFLNEFLSFGGFLSCTHERGIYEKKILDSITGDPIDVEVTP